MTPPILFPTSPSPTTQELLDAAMKRLEETVRESEQLLEMLEHMEVTHDCPVPTS